MPVGKMFTVNSVAANSIVAEGLRNVLEPDFELIENGIKPIGLDKHILHIPLPTPFRAIPPRNIWPGA